MVVFTYIEKNDLEALYDRRLRVFSMMYQAYYGMWSQAFYIVYAGIVSRKIGRKNVSIGTSGKLLVSPAIFAKPYVMPIYNYGVDDSYLRLTLEIRTNKEIYYAYYMWVIPIGKVKDWVYVPNNDYRFIGPGNITLFPPNSLRTTVPTQPSNLI